RKSNSCVFFSSRRRHTRSKRDWSSDVCSSDLKTDAVIKEEAALADRTNMVFSGSLVTYGRAEVVVTATGMKTEIGKIASLMNAKIGRASCRERVEMSGRSRCGNKRERR